MIINLPSRRETTVSSVTSYLTQIDQIELFKITRELTNWIKEMACHIGVIYSVMCVCHNWRVFRIQIMNNTIVTKHPFEINGCFLTLNSSKVCWLIGEAEMAHISMTPIKIWDVKKQEHIQRSVNNWGQYVTKLFLTIC